MYTQTVTIPYPAISTTDPWVVVNQTGGGYSGDAGSYHVEMEPTSMELWMTMIIRDEAAKVRDQNSTVDFEKLQTMIDSQDYEMNNYAYAVLGEYSRPLVDALRIMKQYNPSKYSIDAFLKGYISVNKTNILKKTR